MERHALDKKGKRSVPARSHWIFPQSRTSRMLEFNLGETLSKEDRIESLVKFMPSLKEEKQLLTLYYKSVQGLLRKAPDLQLVRIVKPAIHLDTSFYVPT